MNCFFIPRSLVNLYISDDMKGKKMFGNCNNIVAHMAVSVKSSIENTKILPFAFIILNRRVLKKILMRNLKGLSRSQIQIPDSKVMNVCDVFASLELFREFPFTVTRIRKFTPEMSSLCRLRTILSGLSPSFSSLFSLKCV